MSRSIAMSIALTPELRARLDHLSTTERISRGEILRDALERELARRAALKPGRTSKNKKASADAATA